MPKVVSREGSVRIELLERGSVTRSSSTAELAAVVLRLTEPRSAPPKRKITVLKSRAHSLHSLNERKPLTNTQVIYDQNNHTLLRRMRVRRDPLRIHRRTDHDASLSLSRLPASQRRSVFGGSTLAVKPDSVPQ